MFSPWVILSDFGAAFAMGAVGGGLWHGIKGARNSPRVRLAFCLGSLHCILTQMSFFQGERFPGALSVIKSRAPVTGGNFGVWGGMFSTFDCAIKGWRQKEDAWNAIASGFLTGGCLAARSAFLFSLLRAPLAYSRHVNFRWPQVCFWFSSGLRYSVGCLRGRWCFGFQDHERQHTSAAPSLTRKHATTTVMIAIQCSRLEHHYRFSLYRIRTHSRLPLIASVLLSCPHLNITSPPGWTSLI